jgi:hypothetical protein
MRRAAILAVAAALGLSACSQDMDARKAERACEAHGGVSATDSYGNLVTCKDGTVREVGI